MSNFQRLGRGIKASIVIPVLLAALLGLGLQARATIHSSTTVTHSSHYVADVDPYPPSH